MAAHSDFGGRMGWVIAAAFILGIVIGFLIADNAPGPF